MMPEQLVSCHVSHFLEPIYMLFAFAGSLNSQCIEISLHIIILGFVCN